MLRDELKLLQDLANMLLQGSGCHSTTGYSQDMEALLAAECPRIKKAWSGLLFSRAKDDALKRYVRFQQQILLDRSDELLDAISKNLRPATQANDETFLTHSPLLLKGMLELNDFLVQFFYRYIDEQLKIPAAVIPAARKKMSAAAEQAIAALQDMTIDSQLKACIVDYLNDVSTAGNMPALTYHSLAYLVSFAGSIEAAVIVESDRDLTEMVVEILFYLNFNYYGFCQWLLKDITGKKDLLSEADQLPMLKKQSLFLKSMPVVLSKRYDPDILPVNMLLENWLNEAIKQQVLPHDISESALSDKVELKLTVAQLALLIRLLYEEGVFAMKSIAGLLRFFSGHFMSKKQEHISYRSMNKLYYSGDQFTGYAVRALLLRMVAKINKMFFPA